MQLDWHCWFFFFVVGVVKTCGSFTEVKKPEHVLKLFIRFAIAKGVVTYGLELMIALFDIGQGVMRTIMNASGFGGTEDILLPDELIEAIEGCGFFESIPLWAVTLIGSLIITVLSFIIIMSVYAKEIITLDVYADNAQMIADGVAELQPFIDDVLPEEEQMYKEVTDVMVNLDFLDENLEFAG